MEAVALPASKNKLKKQKKNKPTTKPPGLDQGCTPLPPGQLDPGAQPLGLLDLPP
jgi:hypothetical protein